jgi:hypothetical protein
VVSIVNRTLATLDLNPLLINLLNEVTDVVTEVVAAVDSLLGSIVQGNSKINFIIDNLGNIVSCFRERERERENTQHAHARGSLMLAHHLHVFIQCFSSFP